MTTEGNTQPNIILILADDMGFSDIGCYGSEIRTPNIDSLASGGTRFTQMYNSARCCPTRAALLTGLNPHQAGVGHMVFDLGRPEYQGYLNQECVTIAEVLRNHGYSTYMSGKWHVGGNYDTLNPSSWTPGAPTHPIPTQRGFDRFFGIVSGAGNYFDPKPLLHDDKIVAQEDPNMYFSDAVADNAIKMLNEHDAGDEKPFFLHVTFTAPHWPLHAPEEDIARYEGKYRDGWDTLRTNRHEEMKGLGILDSKWEISPRHEDVSRWTDDPNKEWEDLKMATYAAMVDRMDQGIGKIMDKVRAMGAEDNTLVVFLSDNGGCAEFMAEDTDYPDPARYSGETIDGKTIKMGNIVNQRPGPSDTFMSYALPWANASNTPFRLFKRWVHEGGISTPFVVKWPAKMRESRIVNSPMHIIDISATFYDAAGATYPTEHNGNHITPIEGESFLSAIEGGDWSREKPIVWEHEGSRAVRMGEWKLVSEIGKGWELYNIDDDRTELNDLLSSDKPRGDGMDKVYEEWAARCGVVPFPVPPQTWNPLMRSSHSHMSH